MHSEQIIARVEPRRAPHKGDQVWLRILEGRKHFSVRTGERAAAVNTDLPCGQIRLILTKSRRYSRISRVVARPAGTTVGAPDKRAGHSVGVALGQVYAASRSRKRGIPCFRETSGNCSANKS